MVLWLSSGDERLLTPHHKHVERITIFSILNMQHNYTLLGSVLAIKWEFNHLETYRNILRSYFANHKKCLLSFNVKK